jgi:hypothetical protein
MRSNEREIPVSLSGSMLGRLNHVESAKSHTRPLVIDAMNPTRDEILFVLAKDAFVRGETI